MASRDLGKVPWVEKMCQRPRQTSRVAARVAEGEERDRIWEQQKKDVPGSAEYEKMTSREIPVIVLTSAAAG